MTLTKGRVERAVGYVKQNFLRGYTPTSLAEANLAARRWLEEVAHVRVHAETKKTPAGLFQEERLHPLPAALYDVGVVRPAHATRRCRVHLDANRYSVPAACAGTRLTLRIYPDKLRVYHEQQSGYANRTKLWPRKPRNITGPMPITCGAYCRANACDAEKTASSDGSNLPDSPSSKPWIASTGAGPKKSIGNKSSCPG